MGAEQLRVDSKEPSTDSENWGVGCFKNEIQWGDIECDIEPEGLSSSINMWLDWQILNVLII